MRHVLVMTSTGAIGLVAIFVVDLANLFYISLLGIQELAAAIGYSATIMFFSISFCIGFSIAATALTARAIGAGDILSAKKAATASLIFMFLMCCAIAAIMFPLAGEMLHLLGARGETHTKALEFMHIVIPSIPLMGIGIGFSSLLRAQGDARRAMYVTLSSGIAAAIIDPVLIFGLGLGLKGAALSVVIARVLFVVVGWHGTHVIHRMLAPPDFQSVVQLAKPFFVIAIPAVLTQIATPVGNAYVTASIAQFGDSAVAGWAIVGRLFPLAFAAIFSLSGAVGPILSQNYGAGNFDRVNRAMRDSLIFAIIYCFAVWLILALSSEAIVAAFSAKGEAAEMVRFYCYFVAGSFIFAAALFVANTAFNNLGYPLYSTFTNWGRATLGVIPFVYVGQAYGPSGVLAGWGLGGVLFGVVSILICFKILKKLPEKRAKEQEVLPNIPSANSPFTSGKGASAGR
ncbi:MAG: MATE family efflux transporter [Rhizobiaceae bacterium]|nr:MATE family efflux transporter [Rhizobiaceae bacterium]